MKIKVKYTAKIQLRAQTDLTGGNKEVEEKK
jgi:hypothetical protein